MYIVRRTYNTKIDLRQGTVIYKKQARTQDFSQGGTDNLREARNLFLSSHP